MVITVLLENPELSLWDSIKNIAVWQLVRYTTFWKICINHTSSKISDAFHALVYLADNTLVVEKQSPGTARVDIFNILGRAVLNSQIEGAVSRIETFMPNGIYLVRLTSPEGIYIQKVIKK